MDSRVFVKALTKLKHGFVKNKSSILTGASIIFGMGAVGTAVFGTIKAVRKVDEVKEEKGVEKLEPKDLVKTVLPCYIPTAGLELASIACLIGSAKAHKDSIAALSTAYSLSESAFKAYKEKVTETIGEKKEEAIREKISEDKIVNHPPAKQLIINTGDGDTLFYDSVSGRYFTSNIEHIKKSVNDLNRRMIDEIYISLNELYYELKLEEVDCGNMLGWNIDRGYISIHFSAKLTQDQKPCVVLEYSVPPLYNYDK